MKNSGNVQPQFSRSLKYEYLFDFSGFFSCLSKTGEVYDETKYGWLQGRQVWTYATLYQRLERFRRPENINAAKKGNMSQNLSQFMR